MVDRILVVAHDFPYPPNHGGRVDMWGRLRALKRLGFAVDLVASVKETPSAADVERVRSEVAGLAILPRDMHLRSALSSLPFSVRSRGDLRTMPLADDYLAVVLEGEHVAPVLDNPGLRADKRILRVHNNEPRYYRELSDCSDRWLERLFYRLEGWKFGPFSRRVAHACDLLWFISDSERQQFAERHPECGSRAIFLPPPIDLAEMRRRSLVGSKVLFLGRLASATNARGVEWYLAQVHRHLLDLKDYEFVVAGNTERAHLEDLRTAIASNPRSSLNENPAEITDFYEDAAVFVNPVFRGAGLKLKTVEAIRAGLPVVTTSVGAEGSGLVDGKHLLVADSADTFAAAVRKLLRDRSLAESMVLEGQAFLRSEYSHERIISRSLSKA